MIRRHLTTLVCFLPLLLLLGLVACAPAGDGGDTSTSNAVLFSVPDDPTVSFMVWFKVGSQDDPPGKEGLAALTGALLSDGSTTNNAYDAILEKLYPLASSYGTRVDKEMTTVTGRTHVDNLDAYVPLYTDAYLRPAFVQDDFDRLKADQLNFLEKQLRYASDEELGKASLELAIFDGTRYAHPIAGTAAGLNAITLDDVKQFYTSHYTRENAVVALGGGFDDALVTRIEATLDELSSGTTEPVSVTPPAFTGRHVLLIDKENADASISFGFPTTLRRGSRDFYAMWIANSWLGEHRNSSSHLYGVIRETRGMNYGDYSYIEKFPEGGFRNMPPTGVARNHQFFEVWIRTLPNENALFATRAALREMARLVDEGMSEEAFQLTRSFLKKYHLHFAETTQERLGYAVDDRFYGIDGEGHLKRFNQMMDEITREEVNAAIKKHLQLDNIRFAIITGDAAGLQETFVNEAPTPITYPTPKSDEVLEEDKEIAAVPLNVPAENITIVPVDQIFGE